MSPQKILEGKVKEFRRKSSYDETKKQKDIQFPIEETLFS